jgi:hypothetical protein
VYDYVAICGSNGPYIQYEELDAWTENWVCVIFFFSCMKNCPDCFRVFLYVDTMKLIIKVFGLWLNNSLPIKLIQVDDSKWNFIVCDGSIRIWHRRLSSLCILKKWQWRMLIFEVTSVIMMGGGLWNMSYIFIVFCSIWAFMLNKKCIIMKYLCFLLFSTVFCHFSYAPKNDLIFLWEHVAQHFYNNGLVHPNPYM